MSDYDPLLIDESELENESSLITLFLELIRIVEKDIDDLSPTKHGFTPWGLLAAMGAIIAVIFSIGKGVLDVQFAVAASTFLSAHFLLQWLYTIVNITSTGDPVKPNRIYYFRDRFGNGLPVLLFRSVLLVLSFAFALTYWEFDATSVAGYVGFLLVGVFVGFLILAFAKNFLAGNNPAFKKTSLFTILFITTGYVLLVAITLMKLPVPVEGNFVSMSIGVLFAILMLLIDLYLSVITPNPIVEKLRSLRDDIVFRRLGLNEALISYRRIREGTRFDEEIGPELSAVDAKLDERFRNFETMRSLAHRMEQLLPDASSSHAEILSGLEASAPHLEGFHLAKANVERINTELIPAWDTLATKASKVQSMSGDVDSMRLMTTYVDSKDRFFREELEKLAQAADQIDKKREILEHALSLPDKANSSNS